MVVQGVGAFLRDVWRDNEGKTIVVIGHRATKYSLEYWHGSDSLEEIMQRPWEWRDISIFCYELHAHLLEQRAGDR